MVSVGKILAKGTGLVALGLVARDAHIWGKIKSDEYVKTRNAAAAGDYLNNTMMLDKPSMIKSEIQDTMLKWELSNNIRGFFNSIIGYFKGATEGLAYNLLPLGLGTGALFFKSKTLSKYSALGLLAAGVVTIIKDGFGIGKTKGLKLPTE